MSLNRSVTLEFTNQFRAKFEPINIFCLEKAVETTAMCLKP